MATTFLTIGTSTGGVGTSNTTLLSRFNFTGSDPGDSLNVQLFNSNSPATVQSLNLSSGANTINATNCPALANAGGVWLVPPQANTQSVTLKGVTGDTGVALNPAVPFLLTFAATPPTSFVITAGGGITGFQFVWI